MSRPQLQFNLISTNKTISSSVYRLNSTGHRSSLTPGSPTVTFTLPFLVDICPTAFMPYRDLADA